MPPICSECEPLRLQVQLLPDAGMPPQERMPRRPPPLTVCELGNAM